MASIKNTLNAAIRAICGGDEPGDGGDFAAILIFFVGPVGTAMLIKAAKTFLF